VRTYLQRIARFLELLCLTIYLTGGQLARRSELLSIRWRNGAYQDRNLYIINGQLAVVTRYYKLQLQ
jgi:hypothetical protein